MLVDLVQTRPPKDRRFQVWGPVEWVLEISNAIPRYLGPVELALTIPDFI
jgi:hypothetical protein